MPWSAGETGDTQGCYAALGALWKPWGAVSREEGDLGGAEGWKGVGAEMPSEPRACGLSDEGGTALGTGARLDSSQAKLSCHEMPQYCSQTGDVRGIYPLLPLLRRSSLFPPACRGLGHSRGQAYRICS